MNVLQRKNWVICSQAPKSYDKEKVQRPTRYGCTSQMYGDGNGVAQYEIIVLRNGLNLCESTRCCI